MQVVFSDAIKIDSCDVCVLVACDSGRDFIENTIQSVTSNPVPLKVIDGIKSLEYKEIASFDLLCPFGLVEFVIVGAGNKENLSPSGLEKLGGYIVDNIRSKNAKICLFNDIEKDLDTAPAYIASGMILKDWEFDKYKTNKSSKKVDYIECETSFAEVNNQLWIDLNAVKDGVHLVRSLSSEPSNILTTEALADEARSLKKLGIKVHILDKKDMEKLGMNAILGVAKGSEMPPYIAIMEYETDKTLDKIAIVGKGLTFDSGGISIKPSAGMGEMKGDMTGAAVVIGVMKSLALSKAKCNIIGLIGIAENMPSGTAQKPGDVVVSMSGKTIEIDNTDAEGRLVLADVLHYAVTKYEPSIVIDFATLTGAIKVALGQEFAGLFSNSDELADGLLFAGKNVGEKLWRLPLHPSYEPDIKSDIADIKNVGSGRGAGSITAAMFLQHFVGNNVKWAHIDIAATEWDSKNRALSKKGATGFGVRLMCNFIINYYNGGIVL